MGVFFIVASAAVWLYLDLLVSGWRRREQELHAMAITDALTGVANRRRLFEVLDSELARARRYGHPLSCLIADLDFFKRLNDEHGHQVGDQALALAAAALGRSVRVNDLVGRFGGEEFVVVLPHTDADAALIVAERCRQAVRELRIITARGPITISVSIGVACYLPEQMARPEDLLVPADKALYRAKAEGRDRVCVAS
jgi:diguanylate cyclase (GGDEF)-like protein